MTEFLDEWEEADIDMNQVFRFDVDNRSSSDEGKKVGLYCAQVIIIQQRKGIYTPIEIKHFQQGEFERFVSYLNKHFQNMKALWKPIV